MRKCALVMVLLMGGVLMACASKPTTMAAFDEVLCPVLAVLMGTR